MTHLLVYLATIALFCVVLPFAVLLGAWALTGRPPSWVEAILTRVRPARAAAVPPGPPPLARHQLELRRLADQVQRTRTSMRPGLALHVRASTAAYDDALLACCTDLGLTTPAARAPLTDPQRFDVETRLMGAGVRW